jgi:hypothetical protein
MGILEFCYDGTDMRFQDFRLPLPPLADGQPFELCLHIDLPNSPRTRGLSHDYRELGVGLARLRIARKL